MRPRSARSAIPSAHWGCECGGRPGRGPHGRFSRAARLVGVRSFNRERQWGDPTAQRSARAVEARPARGVFAFGTPEFSSLAPRGLGVWAGRRRETQGPLRRRLMEGVPRQHLSQSAPIFGFYSKCVFHLRLLEHTGSDFGSLWRTLFGFSCSQ